MHVLLKRPQCQECCISPAAHQAVYETPNQDTNCVIELPEMYESARIVWGLDRGGEALIRQAGAFHELLKLGLDRRVTQNLFPGNVCNGLRVTRIACSLRIGFPCELRLEEFPLSGAEFATHTFSDHVPTKRSNHIA